MIYILAKPNGLLETSDEPYSAHTESDPDYIPDYVNWQMTTIEYEYELGNKFTGKTLGDGSLAMRCV